MSGLTPVVVFAYARPRHLAKVLECLRSDAVPLVWVYSDGPKGQYDSGAVREVRELVRGIDWCEVRVIARERNLGLGRNVLEGVTEVSTHFDRFIVVEDDLISVPGTYRWVCAALDHFAGSDRVMSVTAWTHPSVTPADVVDRPYFDARAECWYWGTWSQKWRGMQSEPAIEKMAAARNRGVASDAYGADLPEQAENELKKNTWAVRWMYHHLQHNGLCVRPPRSMVEHIGFDATGTNVIPVDANTWANPPLRPAPAIPDEWGDAIEHSECRRLWRRANPGKWTRRLRTLRRRLVPS